MRRLCTRFGIASLGLLIGAAACGIDPKPSCALPAATAAYAKVDNTLVFELRPGESAYYANGARIEATDLPKALKAVFDPRPEELRAVFVARTAPDRCADLLVLARAAKLAGGAAFDAHASGWPIATAAP